MSKPEASYAALAEAYQQTMYLCELPGAEQAALRPGEPLPPAVAFLLASAAPPAGAVITAWNPCSAPLGAAENARRNTALAEALAALEVPYLPARGVADAGNWPSEESFLVLGVDADTAVELAERFGQYALLLLDAEALVELRFTELWTP